MAGGLVPSPAGPAPPPTAPHLPPTCPGGRSTLLRLPVTRRVRRTVRAHGPPPGLTGSRPVFAAHHRGPAAAPSLGPRPLPAHGTPGHRVRSRAGGEQPGRDSRVVPPSARPKGPPSGPPGGKPALPPPGPVRNGSARLTPPASGEGARTPQRARHPFAEWPRRNRASQLLFTFRTFLSNPRTPRGSRADARTPSRMPALGLPPPPVCLPADPVPAALPCLPAAGAAGAAGATRGSAPPETPTPAPPPLLSPPLPPLPLHPGPCLLPQLPPPPPPQAPQYAGPRGHTAGGRWPPALSRPCISLVGIPGGKRAGSWRAAGSLQVRAGRGGRDTVGGAAGRGNGRTR